MTKEGVYLIFFKKEETEGRNVFWLGSTLDVEGMIKLRLSQMKERNLWGLPKEVEKICFGKGESVVDKIFIIPTTSDFTKEEMKWFFGDFLLNNDYEHCTTQLCNWLANNELKFSEKSIKLKEMLYENKLKVYKENGTRYKGTRQYNWCECDNFLNEITINRLVTKPLSYEEILNNTIPTAPTVILEKDKTITDKLLEIECKLRNITKEELINTLISDTAKEIYDIIVE